MRVKHLENITYENNNYKIVAIIVRLIFLTARIKYFCIHS